MVEVAAVPGALACSATPMCVHSVKMGCMTTSTSASLPRPHPRSPRGPLPTCPPRRGGRRSLHLRVEAAKEAEVGERRSYGVLVSDTGRSLAAVRTHLKIEIP